MAQPNLAVIAGSLQTLSDQVALVPNMPGFGALEQRVADLDQRVEQRVGALERRVGALDRRVGDLDQHVGALDRRVTNNHEVLLETIRTNQRAMMELLHNNHREVSNQIAQLQNKQNLQPLRLFNSGLSETTPLRYPPALVVNHPLPLTRHELHGMPTNQCIQVANILELPPLPPSTIVARRRRQIADYLGASSPY